MADIDSDRMAEEQEPQPRSGLIPRDVMKAEIEARAMGALRGSRVPRPPPEGRSAIRRLWSWMAGIGRPKAPRSAGGR